MALRDIQALTFDVYGTVVDWRGSVLDELRALGASKGVNGDWDAFLSEWKGCYRSGMDKVNRGEGPWMTVDAIYRQKLDALLVNYGFRGLPEVEIEHLNRVWRRLRPWPDVVPGLSRLKTRYIISTLSNASFAGMVHLAKYAKLPWDCVITAENAQRYKPCAKVYRTAIELLGGTPREALMVAAHNYDLRAAQDAGMRTAFIPRPKEYGPGQTVNLYPEGEWDVEANDFGELAQILGT
jgi:2-haloacid dehalogenase